MMGVAAAALATGAVHGQETKIGTSFMRAPLEAKTVKGAPYSAEMVNEFMQTLSDGNRIVRKTTGRVYRDSEGRVRREEDRASGSPGTSITDPVSGVTYSLDSDRKIAWKTPSLATAIIMNKMDELKTTLGAKGAAAGNESLAVEKFEVTSGRVTLRRSGEGEQRNVETLQSKVIEGVLADGMRATTTIAAGVVGNERAITIVAEEWTSPELQVLVLTEHKDPRSGDSTYRLLNISRAEPAPSLFEVPSDYTIRETGIRRFERQ
jgi:hypothetical protein